MLIRSRRPAWIAVACAAAALLCACDARAQKILSIPQIPGLTQNLFPPAPTGLVAAPSAPVAIGGRTLFIVYGQTQSDAQDRADLVTLRLEKVLPTLGPDHPPPSVDIRSIDQQLCIMLDGKELISVTDLDSKASGQTEPALATEWSDEIIRTLDWARRLRMPGFYRQQAVRAGGVILVAAIVNALIWVLLRRLLDRPGWISQLLVWLIAIYQITAMFPQTQAIHAIIETGVLRPFSIILIVVLAASVLSRVYRLALRVVFPPAPDVLSPEARTERTQRRRMTLTMVARITGVTIIWIFAFAVALDWIGVNLATFLTSAGLIGVVIGLAAQDTMKDIVAGVNILVDDRFGVGDVIEVGSFTGTVENLNLRVTQIRDTQGRLITVPNRSIELVANHTARWSQIDFRVGVAYDTELRSAMALLRKIGEKLAADYPHQILAPPEVWGVDSYNDSDVTLRMVVRTAPGDQWMISRELRLRVKEEFDAAGIDMPFPTSVVHQHIVPPPSADRANGRDGNGKGEMAEKSNEKRSSG